MTSLTQKRLTAISQALEYRLAFPIKKNTVDRIDYERALDWARAEMARRKRRRAAVNQRTAAQ